MDKEGNPTHKTCILEWNFEMYPKYHFDMIWASPPCVQYSCARTVASTPRDLVGADKLVLQVLAIIAYFDPPCFFIENQWSGLLRQRPIMTPLPTPKKVSYCKYGFNYQKHTAIWTDSDIEFETCKNDCDSLVPDSIIDGSGRRRRIHLSSAQRGSYKYSNH